MNEIVALPLFLLGTTALVWYGSHSSQQQELAKGSLQTPDQTQAPTKVEDEIRELDIGMVLTGLGFVAAIAAKFVNPLLELLAIPCVLIPTIPLFGRAWITVCQKRTVTFAALELIGLVAALGARQFALCALGFTIFQAGRRLLLQTRRRARNDLGRTLIDGNQRIWVIRNGVEVEIAFDNLQKGEHVRVAAGQTIPCDGTLVKGCLAVDERMLTGESILAEKMPGDTVLGMTLLVSGQGVVAAKRAGSETLAVRLAELIARTESYEQFVESKSEAIADATALPSLAAASLTFAFWGVRGAVAGIWANFIDTLWLSAPISAIGLTRAAARHGILVRDGRSLDLLAEVDMVVFDKTGTLTENTLEVVGIDPAPGLQRSDLLRLAAGAEHRQTHPIALAITKAALAERIDPHALKVGESSYETGIGLQIKVEGLEVMLGSRRMLARGGISLSSDVRDRLTAASELGRSVVCMAVEGRYAGAIELAPELRPEAKAVVHTLQARGLDLLILTGDDEEPTRTLAESLGISQWYAQMLPEDKSEKVAALQAQGKRVCFVGDGINDALAMRHAQVSVSLTGASAIAIDSAQIVLCDGSLGWLDALFDLGRRNQVANKCMLGAALIPSVLGFGGVLFAGLGPESMIGLYTVAQSASMVVALTSTYWQAKTYEGS